MANYLIRLAIAVDQLGNAAIGGEPDETISSRAWRNRYRPVWGFVRKVIDTLFFFQKDHCEWSFKVERERRQMPPELR